ncbi:MAG: SET domain-containing protein [Niabella sp.]
MGRGVFTAAPITKDSVIEIAPVVVLDEKARFLLDQTLLHDYIFEWGNDNKECCVALGWVSLYNHSYQSNCDYEMDYNGQTITIRTVRDIKAGEELFINYNGVWDDEKPLWFDAR